MYINWLYFVVGITAPTLWLSLCSLFGGGHGFSGLQWWVKTKLLEAIDCGVSVFATV